MSETRHFGLTLLAAAQAQKHVTVNEALARLDCLASGVVESASTPEPPASPRDGDVFIVPLDGAAAWGVGAGRLCFNLNGLWYNTSPRPGQTVWVRDRNEALEHDGTAWHAAGAVPASGGHAALRSITIDHDLSTGAETEAVIPDKAVVIGVTGRVVEAIGGSGLSGWSLGIPGAAGRYGSGYGCDAGSWAIGVTGSPLAYYGATALLIEGEGGTAESGLLRLCVHCHVLIPPAMP